ncbi:hypothetical protein DFS33DRAFT_1439237 [Desarmillaria ectypa]|nr:hypothetical protein DFS33DRAFT_1439237 [Desarmillaria ectypa]
MLFHIFVLIPFASLAVADPLVGVSEVEPLVGGLSNISETVIAFQGACSTFSASSSFVDALAIATKGDLLDKQIKSATQVVPSHVVSEADGQVVLDKLPALLSLIAAAFQSFIGLESKLAAIHGITNVCNIVTEIVAASTDFMNKVLDCMPTECVADFKANQDEIVAWMTKAQAVYCLEGELV